MRYIGILLAVLLLGGCKLTDIRDGVARFIGPDDADAVIAWVDDARARLDLAARDEGENLRLALERAEAEIRLALGQARAQLLDEARRLEAEAKLRLAEQALAGFDQALGVP